MSKKLYVRPTAVPWHSPYLTVGKLYEFTPGSHGKLTGGEITDDGGDTIYIVTEHCPFTSSHLEGSGGKFEFAALSPNGRDTE